MKSVIAFIVLTAGMLAFVLAENEYVNLTPKNIGSDERVDHLWLVAVCIAIVIVVDAVVIALTLRGRRP